MMTRDRMESSTEVISLVNARFENMGAGISTMTTAEDVGDSISTMKTRSEMEKVRDVAALVNLHAKDSIRIPRRRNVKTEFGSWLRYERKDQQLLPGIPNEVTLDLITPKLAWRDVQNLSSVSSAWREAIQSRQAYDARRRARATETFVLISPFHSDDGRWIALYSTKEKRFYRLPGIPLGDKPGIPEACQCISLDGKVYVLGGLSIGSDHTSASRSMYVMDLAGPKRWKQCASMKHARYCFGCGIFDGNIFVCGGSSGEPMCEVEVYDPGSDVWSARKSMINMRLGSQVAALGDEVLVHNGLVFYDRPGLGVRRYFLRANFPEIYNPVFDEWRVLKKPFHGQIGKYEFTSRGEIHSIDMHEISVYDFRKRRWTDKHMFDLKALKPEIGKLSHDVAAPLVVGNEIVRLIADNGPDAVHLLHSLGFNNKKVAECDPENLSLPLAWQRAECPFPMGGESLLTPFMSIIQL